jgi:lysophospholipase L1-like esterase
MGFVTLALSSTSASAQRVLVAGDSTASSYPQARAPQAGWGQVLGYFLDDDVELLNRAVSGRSTKSYIDEGKWDALVAELQPGDVVLISFGHNDSRDDAPERYTRPDGAFRDNLARFARDVTEKGGTPVIVSSAARRLWEGPAMVETHGLYALNAKLAAEEIGAAFIDLANLSLAYFEQIGREGTKNDFLWLSPENGNARFPDGVEDNTHFTALGACGVAYVIAQSLAQIEDAAAFVNARSIDRTAGPAAQGRPATVIDCAAEAAWLPDAP